MTDKDPYPCNDCFPCYDYRNHRNERLYCDKGHCKEFGNPRLCDKEHGDWSPEPGCDYEPETRETKAIEEVKAAIKRYEGGK